MLLAKTVLFDKAPNDFNFHGFLGAEMKLKSSSFIKILVGCNRKKEVHLTMAGWDRFLRAGMLTQVTHLISSPPRLITHLSPITIHLSNILQQPHMWKAKRREIEMPRDGIK